MPGSGKSTIGKELARRFGVRFVDCDKAIEEREGCSVAHIFSRDGEAAFRELEVLVLAELVNGGAGVIATGGGAVLSSDNRELLGTRTTCVYLNVPLELLWKRLRRDRRRPLLQVQDAETRLRELAAAREPLYRQIAEVVVDTRGLSFEQVVDTIVQQLGPSTAAP